MTTDSQVLDQLQLAQRHLLGLKSFTALVHYLLDDLPAIFESLAAELRLHDDDGRLAALLPDRNALGGAVSLFRDSYGLYQLYPGSAETTLIDLDDPRMFKILSATNQASGAVMMPLFDGNRLVGSYHLAMTEKMTGFGELEHGLLSMLGQLVAAALTRVVEFQQLNRLSLLHPITEIGNARALDQYLLREIFWARRVEQPVSLVAVTIDELDGIARDHGEPASQFVQRRLAQRLCSNLRATDYITHLASAQFGIVLPACNEAQAHAIGERLRADIDQFAMDNGRGAVLQSTLSVALVCWEPTRHPVNASERLAEQLKSEVRAALRKAEDAGGNRLAVGRVGLLML